MANQSLFKKWKYRLIEPHFPDVGIEINSDAVRLAVVSQNHGGVNVPHLDIEKLPEGAVQITPFHPNIQSMEAVTNAIQSLWSRNPVKSSRICLLVQDRCALTFQVNLEQPSASRKETVDLIRFKVKKSVPFRIEDAEISYFNSSGSPEYSAQNLWVTVMNHAVSKQYEEFLAASIQTECGLMDLTTFNLMNLADYEVRKHNLETEDHLFINFNLDYISLAITKRNQLALFRSRELERGNGKFQEAMNEIYPTTLFYVDKLGGEKLSSTFLYAPEGADRIADAIRKELNLNPILLTAREYLKTHFDPKADSLIHSFSPLLSILISRRMEYL